MAEIIIIGGINIDIECAPFEQLKRKDSNPGLISTAYGGVGRNITENLARLGGDVALVSVIGEDRMGLAAVNELSQLGVDVSHVRQMNGRNSAMYMSILDEDRDMEIALCDMEIIKEINPDYIASIKEFLRQSDIVALDGNLEEDLIEQTVQILEGTPLFFDPVSASKAIRGKKHVGSFYSIKPNLIEAEVLSGITINGDEDIRRAGQWFIDKGVKQVFITLNKDGVYYKNKYKEGFIRPKSNLKIISATGAGDCFSAVILLGTVKKLDIEEIAKLAMAASSIAVESRDAVNKEITLDEIMRRRKENV